MTSIDESPSGRRAESPLGRKRDDDRTQAILEVAAELLVEVGFDRFRIQDVAERAGSGTGAIYRRWETKEALAADAVRVIPDPEVIETDDPVADLFKLLRTKIALAAHNPDLLTGAVAAIRSDAHIAAAFRERYTLSAYRRAIGRVIGEDHPRLDLLSEIGPALALHRCSLNPEPIDADDLTQQIVDLVTDLASE